MCVSLKSHGDGGTAHGDGARGSIQHTIKNRGGNSNESRHNLCESPPPRFEPGGGGRGKGRIFVQRRLRDRVLRVSLVITKLARELLGYKVICVWSVEASPEMRTPAPQSCESIVYLATIEQGSALEATGVAVKKAVDILQLSAVTVGGESGVPVADARSELLGFRIWHTDPAEANKRLQQEVSERPGLALSAGRRHQQADIQVSLLSEQMPSDK